MVIVGQKTVNRLLCVLLVLCLCCFICGCKKQTNFVNTHQMPGHRVLDLLDNTVSSTKKQDSGSALVRTKSGMYIYKDNSVINTSGYKFQLRDRTDIGPSDVRFDAEHFTTRY